MPGMHTSYYARNKNNEMKYCCVLYIDGRGLFVVFISSFYLVSICICISIFTIVVGEILAFCCLLVSPSSLVVVRMNI